MKLICAFVRIVAGAIYCERSDLESANLNMFGDTTFVNNTALDGDGGERNTKSTSCHAQRHEWVRTGNYSLMVLLTELYKVENSRVQIFMNGHQLLLRSPKG